MTRWAVHRRISIRWYVAAGAALIVMASALTAAFVAYRIESHAVTSRFTAVSSATSRADAQHLANMSYTGGTNGVMLGAETDGGSRLFSAYAVLNRAGTMVAPKGCYTVLCLPPPSEIKRAAAGHLAAQTWSTVEGHRLYLTVEPISGADDYSVMEGYDFTPELRHLADLRTSLLRLALAGVIAAILLGVVIGTLASRPLVRAASAATRFGDGDLTTRVPVRGGRELARLGEQFNAMAERLSATIEALHLSQTLQRRFVADVSHELRTPLAAMIAAQGAVDAGRGGEQTAGILRNQTRRLDRLVQDLLEISRFDAGQAVLDCEPVDLEALCRDVVGADGVTDVHLAVLGDPVVTADARRVHVIVTNLVTNARRHGAAPITLDIDGTGDPVTLTVTDAGPGVPSWLRDGVFDRFVRGDVSRGGESTGLGLAIARENARIQGGSIELAPGPRTSFVVRLPRAADPPDTGADDTVS